MLFFFFFNDTATTEIYTLSLHDAFPILIKREKRNLLFSHRVWSFLLLFSQTTTKSGEKLSSYRLSRNAQAVKIDRKSTRLNSSHTVISYAVFCLKKKRRKTITQTRTALQ